MLLTISDILDAAALKAARDLISTLRWTDGALTAGATARAVKKNRQADLTSRTGAELRDMCLTAIRRHPVLKAAAWPRRFSKLIISRTGPGDGYGLHIDNAYLGEGAERMRTDLSFTLFMSDPADYEGGELSIEHAGFTQRLKPEAGALVLYPSTSLHEVRPVTRGDRIACVGWIESAVAASPDREILFDLENLKASLAAAYPPQSPEMLVLAKTVSNLLRRFS